MSHPKGSRDVWGVWSLGREGGRVRPSEKQTRKPEKWRDRETEEMRGRGKEGKGANEQEGGKRGRVRGREREIEETERVKNC